MKHVGWRKEPTRHSLAAHGIKTRNTHHIRATHDPNQRVKIHGMDVSRWRCPECYRGLRDDTCSIHGRVHKQVVDITKSPRAQDYAIYYRVTNELSRDEPRYAPGTPDPKADPHSAEVQRWLDEDVGEHETASPAEVVGEEHGLSVKQLAKRTGIDELILIEHLDKIDPYDGKTYREGYVETYDLNSSGRPIVLDITGKGSFDGDLRISLEGAEELAPLLKSRGVAIQAWSAFKSSSGTQKINGRIKGVDVDLKVTHPGKDLYHVEGDMFYHIDRTFTRKELTGFYEKVKELM